MNNAQLLALTVRDAGLGVVLAVAVLISVAPVLYGSVVLWFVFLAWLADVL